MFGWWDLLKQDRGRKKTGEAERWGGVERGAQGRERMAAADKLQARNTQTTAVYENDESGIIVTPAVNVVIMGHFLQRQHLPVTASAFRGAIMGFVPRLQGAAGVRGWEAGVVGILKGYGVFYRKSSLGGRIHFHWFVQIVLNGPGNNCWQK